MKTNNKNSALNPMTACRCVPMHAPCFGFDTGRGCDTVHDALLELLDDVREPTRVYPTGAAEDAREKDRS